MEEYNFDDKIDKEINYPEGLTKKEKLHYRMVKNFYDKCDDDELKLIIDIILGQYTIAGLSISLRFFDWFVTRYCGLYEICIKVNNKYGKEDYFNIHNKYKAQLDSYNKEKFDPFKRNNTKVNKKNKQFSMSTIIEPSNQTNQTNQINQVNQINENDTSNNSELSNMSDIQNVMKMDNKKAIIDKKFVFTTKLKDKEGNNIEFLTTLGQLLFFRWTLQNDIIKYIEENFMDIRSKIDYVNNKFKEEKDKKKQRKMRYENLSDKITESSSIISISLNKEELICEI